MDPFAGSGTVGQAAARLGRRFVLYDINPDYVALMQRAAQNWLGQSAEDILCLNVPSISNVSRLF
jgi:DNA modification methylase